MLDRKMFSRSFSITSLILFFCHDFYADRLNITKADIVKTKVPISLKPYS
jgi:hypothetical protein